MFSHEALIILVYLIKESTFGPVLYKKPSVYLLGDLGVTCLLQHPHWGMVSVFTRIQNIGVPQGSNVGPIIQETI